MSFKVFRFVMFVLLETVGQPIIDSTGSQSGKEQKTLRMQQGIFTKQDVTDT